VTDPGPPAAGRSDGSVRPGDLGPTVRAFVGLGSNLGDRWAILRRAVDQLRGAGRVAVVAVSPVYETAPVGGPDGQGPFLNLVVELAVPAPADPYRLLEECRRLEAAAGRVRTVRWGPRTLDADVLWIDGTTVADVELTVPHPRYTERRFVLAPLADLAPDLVDEAMAAAAFGEVTEVGTL
jgi:2-amino-4-hydroxy-6-hydroxymethyldihydropteridine diphosphokinase